VAAVDLRQGYVVRAASATPKRVFGSTAALLRKIKEDLGHRNTMFGFVITNPQPYLPSPR
jgi:hypothetical protein